MIWLAWLAGSLIGGGLCGWIAAAGYRLGRRHAGYLLARRHGDHAHLVDGPPSAVSGDLDDAP